MKIRNKIFDKQQPALTPAWGLYIYLLYLIIFFTTWSVNGVDYPTIGKTLKSLQLHYAMPTLLASAAIIVAISAFGWWKVSLFDKKKSGPKWAWLGPIIMGVLIAGGLLRINADNLNMGLLFWGVLGAVGVGFGEEMITRGTLLVGLRTKYTETKVWLISTLAFAGLHLPNMLFGLAVSGTIVQFILTFIMGSLLYSTRRLSGTLILPMILHGLWDSSIFLQGATGSSAWSIQVIIYPIAIICAIAVIRKNRIKRHS